MRRLIVIAAAAVTLSVGLAVGQGTTLVGAGYSSPSVIRVAPGQVTTLFVSGLKTVLSQQVTATTVPLPTTLAGISLELSQPASGLAPMPVPLFSVRQLPVCSDVASPATPDCLITAITVQIPFEMPLPASGTTAAMQLTVAENGSVSSAFKVLPVLDNLHIMTTCDVFPSPKVLRVSQPAPVSVLCVPLVTHANGDLVFAGDPAKADEEVVIWAFGLGSTTPAVKTGTATPAPAPTVPLGSVVVQYDARPNAGPSRPYINPLIMAPFFPGAIFAGLTPGQVGLYQINVRIPDSLSPVPACTALASETGNPLNVVTSNLTIDIGGPTSFDGAPICVAPPE